MFARAEGTKVRLHLSHEDPEAYLAPIEELREAKAAFDAQVPHLSTFELLPFSARVTAAEDDVDDLFTETLSIESAQKVLRSLEKAIVQAKVADGRFNRDGADVIPFPYPRVTPRDAA